MAKFEDLPFEVMGMVLKNLASPEDLGATIHASRRALAALQCDRQGILTKVICNNLSPEVLKEAVSILNCPIFKSGDEYRTSIMRPSGWPSRPGTWCHKLSDFETWYFNTSPADIVFPQDMAQIAAVYRMRATVNSLIADLVAYTNAMSAPEGLYPALYAPEKTNLECLTPCELGRVQIAFLRYELLCRFTGLPYLQQFLSEKQITLTDDWRFFAKYSIRAVEEVTQVHGYICSKYNLAFKEIDDDITAVVKDNPKRVSRYPRRQSPLRPGPVLARQLVEKDGPRFLHPRARRLPSYSEINRRLLIYVYVTNLSKLGLGALRCFLMKDRIGRRRFITETFQVLLPHNLNVDGDLILRKAFPDTGARFGNNWHRLYRPRPQPNLAEVSTNHCTFSEINKLVLEKVEFRKLCWAFWDLERLKQLGIITAESNESNIILCTPLRVQQTYQERRNLDPDLAVLDQEVEERVWDKEFRAKFNTTPSSCKGFEEYCLQLKPILQFAEDAGMEK